MTDFKLIFKQGVESLRRAVLCDPLMQTVERFSMEPFAWLKRSSVGNSAAVITATHRATYAVAATAADNERSNSSAGGIWCKGRRNLSTEKGPNAVVVAQRARRVQRASLPAPTIADMPYVSGILHDLQRMLYTRKLGATVALLPDLPSPGLPPQSKTEARLTQVLEVHISSMPELKSLLTSSLSFSDTLESIDPAEALEALESQVLVADSNGDDIVSIEALAAAEADTDTDSDACSDAGPGCGGGGAEHGGGGGAVQPCSGGGAGGSEERAGPGAAAASGSSGAADAGMVADGDEAAADACAVVKAAAIFGRTENRSLRLQLRRQVAADRKLADETAAAAIANEEAAARSASDAAARPRAPSTHISSSAGGAGGGGSGKAADKPVKRRRVAKGAGGGVAVASSSSSSKQGGAGAGRAAAPAAPVAAASSAAAALAALAPEVHAVSSGSDCEEEEEEEADSTLEG